MDSSEVLVARYRELVQAANKAQSRAEEEAIESEASEILDRLEASGFDIETITDTGS